MLEVEEKGNTSPTLQNLFRLCKLKIVKIREQTCTAVMSRIGFLNMHWAQHYVYLKAMHMHMHSSCKLLSWGGCAASESEGGTKSLPSVLQHCYSTGNLYRNAAWY